MKNSALLKNYITLLLLSIALFSCEDVIQADLDTGEPKLVIDAEILWQKGTDGTQQVIRISRMAPYYTPETPKVSGAQVYVENSAGDQFLFTETAPGEYTCTNFVPILNETYTMTVQADGQVYTATETLMPVPEISRTEQIDNGGFTAEETEVAIFFNDPANETNYYLVSYVSPIFINPDYEVNDDELTDGNEMKSDFSHEDLESGVSLQITLRGISHQFYNYMNLILSAADSDPFSTPPANIKGNILNQDSNGPDALGYFRLSETDYLDYILE